MPSNQEKGIDIPKAKGPTGNNHLLVIAIDDYAHCPKLSNCVKDAKDFAQLLWERYQFDEAHTYFLLDQAATRPNILNTIRDLRMQVKEADSLVIYYSGHGQTVDDVGYWIPVDAAPDSEVDFVSTLELKPRLDAINSFHTFLIADACFSGALFLQFKDTPVAAGEDKRSRWGLAASHSREKALDGTPGENSPFSERLLKNLRNNTESLGIQKLAGKLIDEVFVTSDRKQTPVFKPLNVKGDDSGQFVFKLRKEDEDSVWAEALAGKSAVSIKKYLSRYPKGAYATVAHGLLRDLEEESEWERVLATDSIDALLDFIDRFPQGRLRKQARERIDLLEDNQDWQRATSSNRIADYLEYKEKHPNGRNFGEADKRIGAIRTQQREADAWRKAQNEHSERGYRRYLEDFPTGTNVQKAKAELESIAQKERIGADRARDEAAWSKARGEDTVLAYQQYLDGFSEGMYRKAAAEKMEALERAALLESAAGRDRQAWDRAVQEHTITAYRGYLGSGHLLFKKEAEQAIAGLQESSARQKDAAAWNEAVRKNTREGYLEYIRAGHTLHKEEAEKLAARIPADPGSDGGSSSRINNEPGRKKELKQLGFAVAAVFLVIALIWRLRENMQQTKRLETIEQLNEKMVLVSGGTFTMGCTKKQGSDCEYDEKPAHQVTVSDFYISRYEVTEKEWRAVMESDPPNTISKGCDNCPAANVSWNDIQQFLSKLNAKTGKAYRLPTEAEWEYAARGGSSSRGYKYAGSNSLDEVAWYESNSGSKTRPVGQKKANELGLYDMSGNVWEWCQDWHGDYSSSAQTNPKGPGTGFVRVGRGGSWFSVPQNCRVAVRHYGSPGDRHYSPGFRLSRTL